MRGDPAFWDAWSEGPYVRRASDGSCDLRVSVRKAGIPHAACVIWVDSGMFSISSHRSGIAQRLLPYLGEDVALVVAEVRKGMPVTSALPLVGPALALCDGGATFGHKHPAQAADAAAAVRWVKRNAASLGVDPACLLTVGYSAGGHGVLYHAVRPNGYGPHTIHVDGAWVEDEGDASVRGVGSLAAVVNPLVRCQRMRATCNYLLHKKAEVTEAYFEDKTQMKEAGVAWLLRNGATHFPLVYIAQAENDTSVPAETTEEVVAVYKDLAPGCSEHKLFSGTTHETLSASVELRDDLCAWVKRTIALQP